MKVVSTVFLRLRPGLREEWLQSMFPAAPGALPNPNALQLAGFMSKEEAEVSLLFCTCEEDKWMADGMSKGGGEDDSTIDRLLFTAQWSLLSDKNSPQSGGNLASAGKRGRGVRRARTLATSSHWFVPVNTRVTILKGSYSGAISGSSCRTVPSSW